MRIEHHPKLNIWVREDGCVYLPQSGSNKAHWTFGNKRKDGYCLVRVGGRGYLVHRLVAETFIPNPDNKPEVDHISRIKTNDVENLRWVTHSQNQRNTSKNDRVDARDGTHSYEDEKQYNREYNREYYTKNHEKALAHQKELNARRRKTHKRVLFSDGSYHWLPNSEALELLKLPVKERIYDKV